MKSVFIFTTICSLTNIVPSILGIKKFKLTHNKYHSFIVFLSIGAVSELIARLLIIYHQYRYARILANFYILFEGIVFLFIFFQWEAFKKKIILILFVFLFSAIWLIDSFILKSFSKVNSLYSVIYSIIIVLFAIKLLQQEYFNNIKYSLKDPLVIISTMLIINYSYRAVFESLYLFKLDFSNDFYSDAFDIFVILNVVSNCTFTYAISCMDLRKRLTLY
jgi:hypothetical protein